MWRLQSLFDLWKKLTSSSINGQIFGAAMTIAALTALVKVAAVAKELVVAQTFGTGDELDAFLIALVVPYFIINVVAGSFNTALIPIYMQVREQEGTKAAQRLFSGATTSGLGLLVITTLLMVASAPLYLPHIAAGFNPKKLELTFHLLYAIAPLILLSGMIVIWSAILNAQERFALAAVSPVITSIVSVILLLVFKSNGIFALAAGLVCGAVLEAAVLGLAVYKQGISLLPKWYGFNTHLRQLASQYTPRLVGAFVMCNTTLVDQSMAAMLAPGSVAALNYAYRVTAFPKTLTTTALSTAMVPYFSKMIAQENWIGVRRTFQQYIKLILIVTVPLTVLLITFTEPIVQILFQRGSFTASDTRLVAQIQACYALQIPFYVMENFAMRLITSMKVTHLLIWGAVLNLSINIAGNYFFMYWFGVKGIALSTSCVYLFSFFYLMFFAYKNLNRFTLIQKNII